MPFEAAASQAVSGEGGVIAARLGSGARFKALTSKFADKGAKDPKALAARIGKKKYGKAAFQKMAAAGRKKK